MKDALTWNLELCFFLLQLNKTFLQQVSISFSLRTLPDEDIIGRLSFFLVDSGSEFLEAQTQVLVWWPIAALSMENVLQPAVFSTDLNELKVKQQR